MAREPGPARLSEEGSLLKRFAADPAELLKVALGLAELSQVGKAIELVQAVGRIAPNDRRLGQIERAILNSGVPKYHLAMVADAERNRAFAEAIDRAAPLARHVLDLGTGSGLLAMIAARAGAERTSACEGNPVMAYAAEQIIAANGLSDLIRVHHRHSLDLDPEEHLEGKVDLIVSETFAHDLVGEGALRSISDAVIRLGTDSVKVIPARASIMVAVATFDEALLPPLAGNVCGFDLSLLNRHRRDFLRIDVDHPALALASDCTALFDFDLSAREHDREASAVVTATGGSANGIVQWIRLHLDERISYENRPGQHRSSHWQAVFRPFERRTLEQGTKLRICGWRDELSLRIWEHHGAKAAH